MDSRILRRTARSAAFAAAAVVLYLSFHGAAQWTDRYLFRYGTFDMSRGELGFRLNVLLLILPAAALIAALLAERPGLRLVGPFDALDRGLSRIWLVAAMLVTLELVAIVRFGVLRAAAITDDENVYLFQARLLAAGHLSIASLPEPVRAFFDNQFIINNGRWFGMYFIGHAAVLALGLTVGLSEWTGAITAALTVPLAVGIARRVYGPRVAVLAGIFLVLSPFFIFVSATQLSQPTSSLFLALFAYAAVRIEAAALDVRWWVVAAAALSAAAIVRPQAAAVVAVPFLARLALLGARRRIQPSALGVGAGAIVLGLGAAAFLSINHALTGHALRTSYHAYWETVRPFSVRTGPLYPFRELAQNLGHLNFWLFGWPVSLAFLPFFRRCGLGLTLAVVPGLLLAGQALTGVPTVAAVGPVYFTEAIVPLAILSASGFDEAVGWVRRRFADGWPTRFVLAAPVAGALTALVVFVPAQVRSLRLMAEIARAPYDLVQAGHLTHAVVFVHSLPALHQAPGAWVYYHRNPRPDLSDDVLFVRDLGPIRNADLVRYLGDRTPYVMGMRDGRLLLAPLSP